MDNERALCLLGRRRTLVLSLLLLVCTEPPELELVISDAAAD